MTEPLASYNAIRDRMMAIAFDNASALTTTVPACPDWTATQLLLHCMSLPVAIGAGDLPSGDPNGWIDGLVQSHDGRSLEEIQTLWLGADDTVAGMLNGGMTLLLDDLSVHEHDLRGALGIPDHDALDIDLAVPGAAASVAPGLTEAGLGSIEVRANGQTWRSHDAEPTWVIETTPWEATRALFSRRTANELRALGGTDAHIAVINAHLPLPTTSLNEA
ncbi:MAG: hypothetical protein WEA11_06290 [Acidimicrobiales bacterium]